jgi:hypothetical protein
VIFREQVRRDREGGEGTAHTTRGSRAHSSWGASSTRWSDPSLPSFAAAAGGSPSAREERVGGEWRRVEIRRLYGWRRRGKP